MLHIKTDVCIDSKYGPQCYLPEWLNMKGRDTYIHIIYTV